MKNLIFILFITSACSQKSEKNVEQENQKALNSLSLTHAEQIASLRIKHQRERDSLISVIEFEKNKSAIDLDIFDFENYIKHHCEVPNDSIRILGANRYSDYKGAHTFAFIDYNTNSRFHDLFMKDYEYNSYSSGNSSVNESLKNGHWLLINNYNKRDFAFYYAQADYRQTGFTVSNFHLVLYQMDESDGILENIESVSSYDGLININDAKHILTPLNNNPEVYTWDNNGKVKYVVHESSLNNFPIIVQDSHNMGAKPLVTFYEPELE